MSKQFEKRLTFLLYGQKGGENRIKIINALRERPYNMNQLSTSLNLNYRTIKHHIDVLLKEELINTAKKGNYGDVFFISHELEENLLLYEKIVNKKLRLDSLKQYVTEINFYQHVIEQMGVGVILTDNEKNVFFWNPAALASFGFSRADTIEYSNDLVNKAVFNDKDLLELIRTKVNVSDFEKEIRDVAGNQRFINVATTPILNPERVPIGRCYMIKDVTEHKLDENRIKELQVLQTKILENIPLGINIKKKDFKVIYQNKLMDKMFGTVSEQKCFEHYWDRNKPCKECHLIKTFETGEVHSIIEEKANGRIYSVIMVPFGEDTVLEILQDISEEKMFESNLLRTERMFTEIMESLSDDLIIINTSDFTIETANKNFLEKHGGKKEVIGKTCYSVLHDRKKPCPGKPDPCPIALAVKDKNVKTLEHRHYDCEGKQIKETITYYPIVGADGKVEKIIILIIDEESAKEEKAGKKETKNKKK